VLRQDDEKMMCGEDVKQPCQREAPEAF